MSDLGLLIFFVAVILSAFMIIVIRNLASKGTYINRQTVVASMLFSILTLYALFSDESWVFNLIWLFPLSLFIGAMSFIFPLSLLWVPGSIYEKIVTIGSKSSVKSKLADSDMEDRNKNDQFKMRSYVVCSLINNIGEKVIDKITPDLSNYEIDEAQAAEIFKIINSMTLFQAQRYYLENLIKEESVALSFELTLFKSFEEVFKFDPKPYLKKLETYIKKGEASREIDYVGYAVLKVIGDPGAIEIFNVSIKYFAFINKPFFESLKEIWKLDEYLLNKESNEVETINPKSDRSKNDKTTKLSRTSKNSYCSNCGESISKQSNFCTKCGASLKE